MSKVIKLKKGLDIKLLGEARQKLAELPLADAYAVTPDDFKGVTPKMLVKEGEQVKAGTALFFDKYRPEVLFTSPVSGTVAAINRGAKRKILNVVVTPDAKQSYEAFAVQNWASMSREDIIALMLKSGLWPTVIQRPYGVIADPLQLPKAIFVSGFDSSPLAPDFNFVLAKEQKSLAIGFDVLKKLTSGKVNLGLKAGASSPFEALTNVEKTYFSGPHPAGNVGVQIHHVNPINKGDVVWTLNVQDVAMLGRFFTSGQVDFTKIIALTGPEVVDTHYVRTVMGTHVGSIVRQANIRQQENESRVRVICGNVLNGTTLAADDFLRFYGSQVTVIQEGDKYEFLGWGMPRFNKFSTSHSYFSWLTPAKEYTLDTNLHGGQRAFVMTGIYDKYLPMDIYPLYLIKAILAGNIDRMENLGIYEVIEEDFALCEFVDPSKNDIQGIIADGINLMIKELN